MVVVGNELSLTHLSTRNATVTPANFIKKLKELSFENTFNPYSECCGVHDLDDAPECRARMLLSILEKAVKQEIDSIWIGRDLGYRGGRRTGLAFTDDVHIPTHAARWGVLAERPTQGEAIKEQTATVVWNAISKIDIPIFLWNIFPLHPHKSGNPFSNRPHNCSERRAGEKCLSQLILLLKPRRLIAVGNDAARSAQCLSKKCVIQVRHPSYGGQTKFLSQIRELYD